MESIDSTSAAYEVGYESLSQFSREYSRFFRPARDARYQNPAERQGFGY
jgi:AraC-like DNA-binding protein